ncbi:MAG TPA: putative glycoside hydrolase [Mobilitalea sp.]|nr:putative glycoside hydrolase [Mobilitalea sp.]
MKNKHDMYIDYNRSNKRRGKRNHSRIGMFIVLFLLCLGLGSATYFGVKAYQKHGKEQKPEDTTNIGDDTTSTQDTDNYQPVIVQTVTNSPRPTTVPTPTITSIPATPTPLAEATDNRIPVKVKGIYVTAPIVGTSKMDDLIQMVDSTEVNAMVIDIKDDHGKITYKMDSALAKEIGAVTNTIPDMKTLVDTLKEKNIYLIARIVAFKDPLLAEKRQDLAIKNPDGTVYRDNNGDGWVNPYKKEVWDYLVDVATQAAMIGFNEIQFDYIRFSTGLGTTDVDFGAGSANISKEEIITKFTKYAYEKIKPLGVYMSADVFGTIISSTQDAALVGQNYSEMAKYLDYICPMIYPSHFGEGNYGIQYPDLEPYNIIRKVLTASKEQLDQIPVGEHRAIVRPWLQDFTASWIKHYQKYGGKELREQIKADYSVDYEEWLLWNASCRYSEDGLLKE